MAMAAKVNRRPALVNDPMPERLIFMATALAPKRIARKAALKEAFRGMSLLSELYFKELSFGSWCGNWTGLGLFCKALLWFPLCFLLCSGSWFMPESMGIVGWG